MVLNFFSSNKCLQTKPIKTGLSAFSVCYVRDPTIIKILEVLKTVTNSLESDGSWKNESYTDSSSCSGKLESIPNAGYEICSEKDNTNKGNSQRCKSEIIKNQRP